MKNVIIDLKEILREARDEEEFYETSTTEAIYTIRALRAVIELGTDVIEVEDDRVENERLSVFLDGGQHIWVPLAAVMEA
jgi:hypothetical protein